MKAKKLYASPKVKKWGTVAQLTQGGNVSSAADKKNLSSV